MGRPQMTVSRRGRNPGRKRRAVAALIVRENALVSDTDCLFCDLTQFREAEVFIENASCIYASTRDPRDPDDVLPGCGVIIPIEHRLSPFDFTPEEWGAVHELLVAAKAAQDERLAPDGYMLLWNCFSEPGGVPHHAHLHVIPRFDDEPLAEGRTVGDQGAGEPPTRSHPAGERGERGRSARAHEGQATTPIAMVPR
jgi:histidine triad (HIT) family protein